MPTIQENSHLILEEKYGHFSTNYTRVYHCPNRSLLWAEFHGMQTFEELTHLHNQVLTFIEELKIPTWLVDTRKLEVMPPEFSVWMGESWTPRALSLGYQLCVVIVPDDFFQSLSVEDTNRNIEEKMKALTNAPFTLTEVTGWNEAEAYLDTVPFAVDTERLNGVTV
jgi:hypothetical protein